MNVRMLAAAVAAVTVAAAGSSGPARGADAWQAADGIHKIQHIIVIMQENRSFDSYFGTYPGVNGIPMKNGHPNDCNPDPDTHECVYSFHQTNLITAGGPHDTPTFAGQYDGGQMDGFEREARLH